MLRATATDAALRGKKGKVVASPTRVRRKATAGRVVPDHKPRWRRILAGICVPLFAVLLAVTVTATWAHYTVLNEKGWVDTVEPIASDPAVTAALSREITDELFAALKPRQAIADALPPKAMFLAAPIATGVHGFIEERVNKIVNSPKFQKLWVSANRIAHKRL